MSRVFAKLVCTLAVGIALAAAPARAEDALPRIRAENAIRVGYTGAAPFAFDTGDGVTGASAEFAKRVVARLGIARIDWVRTSFGDLIAGVRAGRYDLAASGMFITAARRHVAAFSDPYLRVSLGLLVKAGNPLDLHSPQDLLVRTAARVVVLRGSVEERDLERRGLSPSRVLRVNSTEEGRNTVARGRADVLLLALPSVRAMVGDGLEAVAARSDSPGDLPTHDIAFVFAPDQPALLRAWNAAQGEILGTNAHRTAIAPFGFADADIPK